MSATPKMPFQVIPVFDLMNGHAVHAVGGRRDHYQPLRSLLHPSSDPISLVRSARDALGLHTFYLADLDAIGGRPPRCDIARELLALGVHLWIDAGVRDVSSMAPLLDLDPARVTIVAGLETLTGPSELVEILAQTGPERVIFSLDLFDGRPRMPAQAAWGTTNPRALASAAVACGERRLLILDLARVGTGRGLGTNDLLTAIVADHPSVSVAVGGGLSRIEELFDLRAAGATAVLVGSAIHDGRIGARELERLSAGHD